MAILISVYEETAGLMVNDPVLRTHKVNLFFVFLLLFLMVVLKVSANKWDVYFTAFIGGVGTWNIGKYF